MRHKGHLINRTSYLYCMYKISLMLCYSCLNVLWSFKVYCIRCILEISLFQFIEPVSCITEYIIKYYKNVARYTMIYLVSHRVLAVFIPQKHNINRTIHLLHASLPALLMVVYLKYYLVKVSYFNLFICCPLKYFIMSIVITNFVTLFYFYFVLFFVIHNSTHG